MRRRSIILIVLILWTTIVPKTLAQQQSPGQAQSAAQLPSNSTVTPVANTDAESTTLPNGDAGHGMPPGIAHAASSADKGKFICVTPPPMARKDMQSSESRSPRIAETFSAQSSGGVSAAGRQLAVQLGIDSSLDELYRARQQSGWKQDPQVRILKQDLVESILAAELEVRTAQSRLDAEIALADDLRAKLEEGRDKAVTLTALANLVTGAFNGVTGNSFDFSAKTELAGKILDVVEGGVAVSLAALALRQQAGEKRFAGVGGMLGRFFQGQSSDYPESVWTYLNTASLDSKDGKSRRSVLLDRWTTEGIVRRGQARWEHRLKHITKGTVDRHRVTIAVLEDREAMLHDLRATISPMEESLLDIMNVVRAR